MQQRLWLYFGAELLLHAFIASLYFKERAGIGNSTGMLSPMLTNIRLLIPQWYGQQPGHHKREY